MKHISMVSKMPAHAATTDVPMSTLIDFIVAVLTAFKPLITAKYPTTT